MGNISFSVGADFSNQSFNLKSKYETAYVPEFSVDFHFDHRMTTDWYTGLSIGAFVFGKAILLTDIVQVVVIALPVLYLKNSEENTPIILYCGMHI